MIDFLVFLFSGFVWVPIGMIIEHYVNERAKKFKNKNENSMVIKNAKK